MLEASMRREPSLTLRGALAILGRHESRVISKIDKLLGGVILGAGAVAGLAAVGGPVLAPPVALAAVWGWLEQKNEAVALLRQALDAVSSKLMGTAGYQRRQLIGAAHTTIVVAAFFEAFRERISKELFKKLEITEEEKEMIVTGRARLRGERLFDALYAVEVPAPTPARGYEENAAEIESWMLSLSEHLAGFLAGLAAWNNMRLNWSLVSRDAVERYRSHYLALAATVPEFMVWAMLGEHAATRSAISHLRADAATALNADREALGRIEALLALEAQVPYDQLELRSVVERANKGALGQPIVPMGVETYGTDIVFPKIDEIYINPRYRIAEASVYMRPADERWWDGRPSHDDLDLTLAAHFMAPDSTRLPLLLLGHPGPASPC